MEALLLLINPDGSQATDNSWTYVLLASVLLPLALVWLAFPFIVWRKLNQLIQLIRKEEF